MVPIPTQERSSYQCQNVTRFHRNLKICFEMFHLFLFIMEEHMAERETVESGRHFMKCSPPHLLPNTRLSISHSAPLFFFLLLTTPCRALKRDLLVAWWLKPGFQGTKLPVFPHPLLLFSLSMNYFFPKCRVLNDRRMCIVKQWKTHAFSRQQPSSFKINRAVTEKPHASPQNKTNVPNELLINVS